MKLLPSKPSTEKMRFTQLTIPLAGRMRGKPLPKQKKRVKSNVCAPPANPTAVPWAPWVNEVDALPEWKLSGKKVQPSEWAAALEEEGLVDFLLDHPNNPCTLRHYERSSGDGGSVIGAVYFDRRAEGASGYVHEGAIAAVADSLAAFHNMVNGVEGVTKTLDVSFCKPIPLDTCMRADCHETNRKGEEVQRKGSIVDGIDQSIVYAEFDAVFVIVSEELLKYFAQLTPENTMSRGLARRFPLLSMESEECLMDTKVVQELVGKADSDCTQVFKENRQSRYPLGHSSGYVSASRRMKAAYFIGPDRFFSVFSATVECMGPLECVHGGCIFTWFAESMIACMRLRAPFLGVMASRGALKRMSVKYLRRAPLSDIYGIHVTILKQERDSTTDCWIFDLKAEMKSPATGVVLNEAIAEFECGDNQSWELFDHEFIKPRWWAAHDFQNVASSPTLLGRGRDQKICQGDLQKKQDTDLSMAWKAQEQRLECYTEAWKKQREWCASRFTTDRWLAENKREWEALDHLCRTRPWATNRDKAFAYPFIEYTDLMRKVDGPWCGDEVPKIPDTRGEALSEVVTQVVTPQEYPPDWRVVLFTPEFGEHRCFTLDNWSYLEPEDKVDIWVVCWQGWSKFDEMIEQVLHQVLAFADGSSTIWFAEGMGAIIAYEVAKAMEKFESPNKPFGLVVSDCPAPHVFQSDFKPYEMEIFSEALGKTTEKQKLIVNNEVAMMKGYEFKYGDNKKLHMPIKAFYHEECKLGVTEDNTKEWEEYAPDDGFELLDALDDEDLEDGYINGKGYALDVDPSIVSTISEMGALHQRYPVNPEWPDIGDTDGPLPAEIDILVVGTGVNGVYQAMEFKKMTKKSVLVVDRDDGIGGVWKTFGNDYSRVNTSEIGYRWIEKDGIWSRTNEDHTPKYDMMYDMYQMALFNKGNIRFHLNVEKVIQLEDEKYEVTLKHVKKGTGHKLICGFVSLHVNRRIGKARDVDWDQSSKFKGKICYGYRNEVRGLNFWNKDVMIIGAGAFAFENVRSAVEHGAHHCYIMGRRDGTTCPKWIDMIAFLRPLDKYCHTGRAGAAYSFEVWQKCYTEAGLHTPACWAEGLLKPNNHTISVSDLAFIGGFHGLFDVKVGEIAKITDDGLGVILKSGEKIDREIIIKCTGFHLNDEVALITGQENMFPSGLLKFNLNYGAEPLLDGGQFGSQKGSTEIDIDLGYADEEFKAGYEVFKEKGYNELMWLPLGNPFGSGQAGPGRMLSRYMAWLVDNPAEQKAMLAVLGAPQQNVTEFWLSTQNKLWRQQVGKMIANLSKALDSKAAAA